jgi:hypothetical protein
MLSLLSVLFMHVPQDMYLRCEDYEWLKEGIETTTLFTPAQKTEIGRKSRLKERDLTISFL